MTQPMDTIAIASKQRQGSVDQTRRYHLTDLASFPAEDGYRYEIIAGELSVTPAPGHAHGFVATRLANLIRISLSERPQWCFITQPINLETETDETTYHCEPDMSIFDLPEETVAADESIFPVIVIEIVSPGNPNNDYVRKVGAYAVLGIPEYWIIDPRNHAVTFLTLTDETYRQVDRSALLPDLTLMPDALFAGLS